MYSLRRASVFRIYITMIMVNSFLILFYFGLNGSRILPSQPGIPKIFHFYYPMLIFPTLIFLMPCLSLFLLTNWNRNYIYLMKTLLDITPSLKPTVVMLPFQSFANTLFGLLLYIVIFNSPNLSLVTFLIYLVCFPPIVMGINLLAIQLYRSLFFLIED